MRASSDIVLTLTLALSHSVGEGIGCRLQDT